jgi:predicted transcriptional regulator
MKCRIKIVESLSEYNRKLDEKIDKGLLDKNPERAIVMTPEVFSKVFSPERIKLLQRIYRNNVKNIYQLAKELGKPYEVVFRNIKYLEGIGLVKIADEGNKKIPHLTSGLSIDMFSKEMANA